MIESVGYAELFVKETSIAQEKRSGPTVSRDDLLMGGIPDDGAKAVEENKENSQPQQEKEEDQPGHGEKQEEKQEGAWSWKEGRKIRGHESALTAPGGGLMGPGVYPDRETGIDDQKTGSDENQHAVGGQVEIDHKPDDDPETTIRKMARVRYAVLADGKVSMEDRRLAAEAQRLELEARVELMQKEQEGLEAESDDDKEEEESVRDVAGPYDRKDSLPGAFHATV